MGTDEFTFEFCVVGLQTSFETSYLSHPISDLIDMLSEPSNCVFHHII